MGNFMFFKASVLLLYLYIYLCNMCHEKIIIRAARREDASLIAQVVVMAIGGDPATHPIYPMFLELAKREFSQYSYRNALVAQIGSVSVGAIVGYDGDRLRELREPVFDLYKMHTGRELVIEDETDGGEFYLDSVAVLSQYQGLGVGAMLLSAMRDKAFETGFERVGLLVDWDNPRAEKLYHSLGFERINETLFLGHKMWHMQVQDSK
jgi:ribosomal protein S18 acetylase RimI-like enzyme